MSMKRDNTDPLLVRLEYPDACVVYLH